MRALLLALIMSSAAVCAQEERGVGYPTVAAALEALKVRKDVSISAQGDWIIATEQAPYAIWSFTTAGHAAHPAVVRRKLVEQGGGVYMDMTALCQAGKDACDKLIEDFKALNTRMAQDLSTSDKAANVQWQASNEQLVRVEALSRAYFASKDEGRHKEAYAMLAPSQQQLLPFARWSFLTQDFNARAGKLVNRDTRKITWYRNPPQAAPGVYAAVDFAGEYANTSLYCGYLILSEQADGSFLILREEQNVIDKDTAAKLKPGQLEGFRAQFKCK